MAVALNSSQVQQDFGAALDQVLRGEDVIVERDGAPRAAMIEYGRYQTLVDAERALGEARLAQARAASSEHPGEIKEAAAPYQVERSQALTQEFVSPIRNAGGALETYRYVVRSPGICGGQPILRGTRVPVRAIVGYHKLGMSVDEILAGLPHVTPAQLYEALSYYYDHLDEIEREISGESTGPADRALWLAGCGRRADHGRELIPDMIAAPPLFIRLYLDEDVQRGVAAALRGRSFDAISAHEVGRWGLSDAEQLTYAAADGRALFTFNASDFLRLHREWSGSGRPHWGISVSAQALIGEVARRLLNLLNRVTANELRDQIYWLPGYR